MPKITLLKEDTADKLIAKVKRPEGPAASNIHRLDTSESAKVRKLIEIVSSDGDGYYTVKAKTLNDTDSDTANHTLDDLDPAEFTAREITGSTSAEVGKTYPAWLDVSQNNTIFHFQLGGGGSSLIWLTTDNTGLSFNDGAQYDFPAGTGTALTVDDTYYIATPWNTRIAAPNNYFGYFVQDGNDWYHQIEKFYVKPSANYPSGAGAGITTFTCYLNKADTSLNLGTNTAFPFGIKILLAGFDNVNAGTNSLNYFNGKVFPASYDSAANIIYLDHPSF
jgi:hypothetical protein